MCAWQWNVFWQPRRWSSERLMRRDEQLPPHTLLYKDGHMLVSDGQTKECKREQTVRAGQSAGRDHWEEER